MRLRLSIFLLFSLGGTPALADALSPCPAPTISYTCEGGAPALSVTRNARGASLDFKLATLRHSDALMSLPSGSDTLSQPLETLPKGTQQIAIVGSDANGACCFSTLSLAPPRADLCAPQDEDVDEVRMAEETTPFDIALTLDLEPTCKESAGTHTCSGTLSIDVTGTPSGLLPLTLEIEPKQGIDTVLSGPLTCYDTGNGSQFCRAATDILGDGLTLPIQISASPSYTKRTAKLCAALALPSDKTAQIRLVQTALKALEYDPGAIDGQSGPSTREAVKSLAARFDLSIEDPLDPAFLALLGLGPFDDANASNNLACAETILPPQPRPKVVKQPRKVTPKTPSNPEVIYNDTAPVCDPATTVLRGGACACRFEGMYRFNATSCVCENGRPPAAGAQCF